MSRTGQSALAVATLALTAAVAGCGLIPPDYTLHVANSTTLALTLAVNDQQIRVLEPGTHAEVSPGALPALPWAVVLRTASGRIVAKMPVAQGSIVDQRGLDGTGSYSAPVSGVTLSCGSAFMYVGDPPVGGGLAVGVPGDCDP